MPELDLDPMPDSATGEGRRPSELDGQEMPLPSSAGFEDPFLDQQDDDHEN